jgi:hypothetical protein
MNKTPATCDVPADHAPGPIRPYHCGNRCPAHTPAALAGRPEAPEPQTKETQ